MDHHKTFTRYFNDIKKYKKQHVEAQERLTSYTPKPFGEKRTYPQPNWSLYEKACSQEKLMFFRILKDAMNYLNIGYEYKGNGRPGVDYADIVKAMCIKSYHNYSSWRAESELKIAQAMGVIDEIPRRSTLLKYMQDPKVTSILHQLYKTIAQPLATIELYFAADATGISNKYGNTRWMKIRHTPEEETRRREFSKLHIISGCKTNIIAAVRVTKGHAHESPYFKPLLDDTAKIFTVKEVMADAGYLSRDNVKAVSKLEATPFIWGKKGVRITTTGKGTAWNSMLYFWHEEQMFFAQHYHQRSNVESTFSALKRKFGDFCRCKKAGSQENEILAKIVCFNASVLSEALLSYDLNTGFIATL